MNKNILNFLNKITDTLIVNKLLVTSFLTHKKIDIVINKEIKDLIILENNEEYDLFRQFAGILRNENQKLCFEELLELFEFVISPSDKLINGAIYTPKDIRDYITKQCFIDYKVDIFNNVRVADISCGCGGFLINATKEIRKRTKNTKSYKDIYKDNIFGMDIQKYSIERTKILLSLYAISDNEDEEIFEFNLYARDSLEYKWNEENKKIKKSVGFDIILGNPPYVCSRNMDDTTKKAMKNWSTCSTGHPDLYIPFFQIGYELLKPNGILGYITVNTFIKSLNGRAIRQYFNDNQIYLKIIDFEDEQIFNSRMTYTSICFLKKVKSNYLQYIPLKRKQLRNKISYKKHKYDKLDVQKGWYLQNRELILQLEGIGTKFEDIYTTRSGIATLKNNVYIFKPVNETDNFYYFDEKIKIEKGICKDIVNSNLLVKTNQIDKFIEKIIFPYEYDDNNQVFVMAIEKLQKEYPFAYKYLLRNKDILARRDKGKGIDYKYWYAFGRNQSLERTKYKLLFPQLAKKGFQSHISDDENLYFYNGMAVMSNNLKELQILEKIFLTDVFWTYVSSISKHYASGYYSLGKNYIKNFGIFNFSEKEQNYLINSQLTINELNNFINKKFLAIKHNTSKNQNNFLSKLL